MAFLIVLSFDHEGRPIQFDTWLDDLQLYLLSDSRDSVSLFDHTSGASLAPPATADSATRSQWLTRDVAARLAVCNHLPLAERAHFGQHKTAKALAGGCQKSTGDPRLILGKGYRLAVLGGYGRTDPLLKKHFYPSGLVVGILTSGAAADYSAIIPPPLVSPLSGAAADYSAVIPPPLVSPLSSAAANYFTPIPPPHVSPTNSLAADYFTHIPPLISPLIGSAADYLAPIPSPLLSPHICSVDIPSP
ncbi:unnamed protein product [Closterium sp. NIES-54]